MRLIRMGTLVLVVGFGLCASGALAAGDDPATAQLARILLEFVHECSPVQCRRLERLAGDASSPADERFLASALRRVVHRPHPADRDRLRRLSRSERDPGVAVLAETLYGMTHVLTDAEAARVTRLLDEALGRDDLDGCAPRGEVSGGDRLRGTDIRTLVSDEGGSRWLQRVSQRRSKRASSEPSKAPAKS